MSNIEGLNLFGKLTIKTVQSEQAEKINASGSSASGSLIENSEEYDSVDISTVNKKEITEETLNEKNVKLWQEEAKINAEVDLLKEQILKDFAGEDPEDILNIIDMITDFKEDFIDNFPEDEDISTMSATFKEALVTEYESIKEDAKNNTKSAIKDRVIENILEELTKDTEHGGRALLGVVGPEAMTLSEDVKKQITKVLEKESEKYIKNYNGGELESDLTNHLHEFLSETDRDVLSGAAEKWNDDKAKIEKEGLQEKNALRQMRESVKSFLVTALMLGVQIELAGTVIRTEAVIPQVLSNFEDADSLKAALDEVISQLSTSTRKDKLTQQDKQEETQQQENIFSFTQDTNAVNFFKL